MCQFFFRCQSPVTVLCPSVRLLQKSSTVDISSMSCRWKPDSLFHQSCQCAMSWEPCKQVICHYYLLPWFRTWLALLNCTCKSFSASSSSLAAWTLNFRFSYCRIAAAPNEQPVNWQKIHTVILFPSCAAVCPLISVWQVEHTPTVNISGFKSVGRGALGKGVVPGLPVSEGDWFASSKTFPFFVSGLLASRRKPHRCCL